MFIKPEGAIEKGISARRIAAGIIFCLVCSLAAKEVGKFSYKKAPEDFNAPPFSGTVMVSDTMVAMSEYIHVMNQFYTDSIKDTPSVFFVIDHSTSMSHDGNKNDPLGNRFVVTSAFIDTIAKKFPSADVGIGIFKMMLHLRAGDSPFFAPHPMSYDSGGAYLPLYKLNGTYSGQTGAAILKSFLTTKTMHDPDDNVDYAELTYTPSTWPQEGTNINVGFEVAKKALLASPRIKECHYIIFLSDGDANDHLSNDEYEFESGKNVATTFTIYFTHGTTVPASIRRMTTNIRANGYSNSNPRSNYWPFYNTTFDALMNFLMTNVYSAIGLFHPATPKSITVGGTVASTWNPVDSTFKFGSLFPLIGEVTPFNFKIVYGKAKGDTTHTIDFNVRTQAGYQMSKDFDIKTWDRDIIFRFNNNVITTATDAMTPLQLSFPWSGGTADYKYTNVKIELSTVVPPADREIISLTSGAGAFSGNFPRVTTDARTPNNGTLEHAQTGDAIIAVFRNSETPTLPLDTLVVRLPLNIVPLAELDSAVTKDTDGNGYLDRIVLYFSRAIDITATAVSSFTVRYNTVNFPIQSIVKNNDREYELVLNQHAEPSPLETSWKPLIGITLLKNAANVANFPALDGAAPVISTVIKQVVNPDYSKEDIVTVTMSEKITGNGGTPFSAANQPDETFFTWLYPNNTFILVDGVLANINAFDKVLTDDILVFTMSNGQDLNSDHWLNIQAQKLSLCDGRRNFPKDNNRKVRVQVLNPPVVILPVPNPSAPTTKHVPAGDLYFKHEKEALDWVYKDNAGVVISLKNIDLPPKGTGTVGGYIKIYDLVGNVVNWGKSADILNGQTGSPNVLYIYWNGVSHSQMAAAPGVYRVVVYLDYPAASGIKDKKLHTKTGIRR